MTQKQRSRESIEKLLEVMAKLRDAERGCPWDLEQTFATIAPYTIEEAYEVADAIERGDFDELESELGDLLFQVVFHARMAEEQGRFDFADVAAAICDKLVRRHPHVFGEASAETEGDVRKIWGEVKAQEKQEKGEAPKGLLDGISRSAPALVEAQQVSSRAAHAPSAISLCTSATASCW